MGQVLAAPIVILLVMLLWSWWRWLDRPHDPVTTFFGMAFESCLFACILWQLSRNFGTLIELLGVKLQVGAPVSPATRILTFIGRRGFTRKCCSDLVCSWLFT